MDPPGQFSQQVTMASLSFIARTRVPVDQRCSWSHRDRMAHALVRRKIQVELFDDSLSRYGRVKLRTQPKQIYAYLE